MMMGMGHTHIQYYSQKAKAFMEIGAGLLNLLFSLKLQMKRAFPIIHTVYIHTQIQYYTPYTTYPTLPLYFLCFLLLLHQPLASAMTMASARSTEAARFFASTTALVAPTLHTYYTCQCAFMLSTTKSYKSLMMIKKKLLLLVKI